MEADTNRTYRDDAIISWECREKEFHNIMEIAKNRAKFHLIMAENAKYKENTIAIIIGVLSTIIGTMGVIASIIKIPDRWATLATTIISILITICVIFGKICKYDVTAQLNSDARIQYINILTSVQHQLRLDPKYRVDVNEFMVNCSNSLNEVYKSAPPLLSKFLLLEESIEKEKNKPQHRLFKSYAAKVEGNELCLDGEFNEDMLKKILTDYENEASKQYC